jgi:pimeloyl-ACP methyl ester carboxylesterase
MLRARRNLPCLIPILLALLASLPLTACKEAAPPTTPPPPTRPPTATPSPEQALDGALFAIELDGELIATETLRVGRADDQMVVFSEMQRFLDGVLTERRTVLLSTALNPTRYDVERIAYGQRATWVGERHDEDMDCLSSDPAWYAPVLVEGVAPAPEVMLDSAPSALPYALLALRYTSMVEGATLALHSVDILEDYPVSRPLSVTLNAERTGAVIGTVALEGHSAGALNPEFTLWVRRSGRTLYSVEIPNYRFGLWEQRAHASLRQPGTLVIQRVSKLPEAPAVEQTLAGVELAFNGFDGQPRQATLYAPQGGTPFPCVVTPDGPLTTPLAAALVDAGWGVLTYGTRAGIQSAAMLQQQGQDAIAAAKALQGRSEVAADRLVFLGIGDVGLAGATALTEGTPFAGAILASCAQEGLAFPGLAEWRIANVLAPFYAWDPATLERYRQASLTRWQDWLFERQDQINLLSRRVLLGELRELAEFDLAAVLASSPVPVLLLHGEADAWTPAPAAQALAQRLSASGKVTLQVVPGVGEDLGLSAAPPSAEAQKVLLAWLERWAR